MRRITLAFVSALAVFVLLFSYRTSTVVGSGTSMRSPEGHSGASPSAGDDPRKKKSSSDAPRSVDGSVAQTRFGPLRVRITVAAGRVTDVAVPQYPDDGSRQIQINRRALPMLRAQALKTQSAELDGVTGATYTSQGYEQSLQSALDAAHLG